ncbi:MAG: DegT/DnrJ/EryC1/StrS family aminotransferase [Candidatus Nanoarchaeia archaeon]|nr:DegT/DnrJ/EryC1/StrS family aminotransferase [Candidatus Nanoarchaeia archaeon]
MKVPPVKICFSEQDKANIKNEIDEVLSSGMLTLGKHNKRFEEEFSKYTGSKHAIAVNSGTSSLEIPLRITGVKGKNVIVPTNTFFATPASVVHAGGNVKFADVDVETLSINAETVKELADENTTAMMMVHIGGIISPEVEKIQKFCRENNITLIEDAAHAHGCSINGKNAGTFGKASSFSFYPTKVITSGEGGMIITDDDEIDRRARIFRDQGKASFTTNDAVEMGYNWRMSEVHAIIGYHQLKRLDEFIENRNKIAQIYNKELNDVDKIQPLKLPENSRCNYYKYIAVLDSSVNRDVFKKTLKENYEVSCSGEVYDKPCHLQPVFSYLGYKKGDLPVSEDLCSKHVCLPIFPEMTDEQAVYVADSIRKVLK